MVSSKLAKSSVESNIDEFKIRLEVGDLVKFHSSSFFSYAEDRYSSHGVVVAIRHHPESIPESVVRNSYTVIWSDGRESTEWRCYLKKLS